MKSLIIDRHFIEYWHPRYDCIEHDEGEYQEILKIVKLEIEIQGTLTQASFRRILKWKTRNRTRRYVDWDEYEKYENAFHDILCLEDDDKVEKLLTLSGVGIPVASTILHFIYPDYFPIVDNRTVGVLQNSNYPLQRDAVSHYTSKIEGYREFREAIGKILTQNNSYSYREIDRALFAYHKSTN